jgi:hypothetical protein
VDDDDDGTVDIIVDKEGNDKDVAVDGRPPLLLKLSSFVVVDVVGIPFKLCVKLCRRKSQFLRNTLPHAAQWYGLISVCVNR